MNTSELVKIIADRLDETQVDVKKRLQESVKIMLQILDRDTNITIPGLGTFSSHLRGERRSFDPNIKQHILLPPKRVLQFHPSSTIKEKLKDRRV